MSDLMHADIIKNMIYTIRGQRVMLDKDLAALYGVEVRVLNQAVKRNIKRFPEDFMFQLDKSIIYVCLLNFDSALKSHFRRELEREIPVKIPTKKWKRRIINGVLVVSAEDWERNKVLSSLGTCRRI